MPGATDNTKERTADLSIEANKAAETYLRYLQDEIQRLKDEEDRDRWILELVEQNESLEKQIQLLTEQIKKLSPEKEQEAENFKMPHLYSVRGYAAHYDETTLHVDLEPPVAKALIPGYRYVRA